MRTWTHMRTWTAAVKWSDLWSIADRVGQDGYRVPEGYTARSFARAVQRAHREGRLLWTSQRLVVLGADSCDLRPVLA